MYAGIWIRYPQNQIKGNAIMKGLGDKYRGIPSKNQIFPISIIRIMSKVS